MAAGPPQRTPDLKRIPTAAMDAAVSSEAERDCWGKLISLIAGKPNIFLNKPIMTIGRAADNDVVLDNSYVSSLHCTLKLADGVITLLDGSTNGTLVNGTRPAKDTPVTLQGGAEIVIVPPRIGVEQVSFVLQVNDSKVGKPAGPDAAAATAGIEENLICCICQSVVHDCVSVVPCLHPFCGGCWSEWEAHSSGDDCPSCRTKVTSVSRNPTVNNLAEAFLKANPSRRRTAEEIAELDAKNKYTGDKVRDAAGPRKRARRGRRDDPSDDDDDDEDDEDDEEEDESDEEDCRSCLGTSTDGFRCPAGAAHQMCQCCGHNVPERPLLADRPQRCAVCNAFYCHLYWTCPTPCAGCLFRLRDWTPQPGEMDRLVNDNPFESNVLKSHLATKGVAMGTFVGQCIARTQAGEFRCATAPGLRPEMPTCRVCARNIMKELAYQFREKLRDDELPPEARGRGNCWYGRGCRTQHHNMPHASKLNHICEQTRR
eukprot:m.239079 g.239079  ORF g.239079 m.239079 type:complete len:485 (-) comp22302_c0_seq1:51-1505(-)